jgi:hypothetical protein
MSGGLTASNFQSFPAAISAKTPGLAYDDSYTSWEGTGYNGNETQVSAYRDMSNLYGRIRQETEEELNPTDSISVDLSNVERKLVKNASVRIRVENLEAADASVNELMRKYDAYASSTNIQETHYYYTLRVPSPVYDFFLADMNGMGRLLDRLESTEDVTIRYYDLEGRLETKRQLLRTFQLYLGRANNIQEILAVEARIAELQYDIEGTGMQLRSLANRVDYATINLTLLGPVAAIQNRGETFGEQIKQLFGNFGGFLSTVAVVITGIVIYGIPVLLLLIFFFWLLFGRIGLMKKLWQIVKGKK